MSSMVSTPGPTSSMTFLNSFSVQLLGTFPINNLLLVSDIEHLIVLPLKDEMYQEENIDGKCQKGMKEIVSNNQIIPSICNFQITV